MIDGGATLPVDEHDASQASITPGSARETNTL
jgi:hypothetical protein